MATREERAAAYDAVVKALRHAAKIDGFMERVAIAKAMDALGVIISDTSATVVKRAINFRNGALIGDCHLPVDTYLQKDPEPLRWAFGWTEVMRWKCTDSNLENELIQEAHRRALARGYLSGYTDTWYGEVQYGLEAGFFIVTLYPDDSVRLVTVKDEERQPLNLNLGDEAPEGQLPTILIEYEWLLGWTRHDASVELQIVDHAKHQLAIHKPKQYRKLTDGWWAKVTVTDVGYLVTFHYDMEMP